MTPSVADKTPIPTKVWRRHTDPPALWISVIIGSVSLHLLAFWLMRSSNAFSLWFPQQSQSAVPIELIDIAPETKLTAKKVSPKPASATQKPVPAPPQTSRTTPRDEDFGAINSADNLQQKSQIYASQPNRQQKIPVPTPKAVATPKPTVTPQAVATPKPTATPTPTFPVGNLPWNRRQEIKLGRGTALPTGIPSSPPNSTGETPPTPTGETSPTPTGENPPTPTGENPPTPTGETPPTPTGGTSPTPTGETSPTPTGGTPPTPTGETPQTPTGGASIAIIDPLRREEMINFIQTKGFRQDALPDVIASYTGSNAKQLESSFLPGDSEVKPAQMLVSLIIDRNGNFQQAVILEIEPATLQSEKSAYEGILNDVFKTENFLAAHNNDGTKPDLSNLFVRIKIQPANSN
ncbi:hypothetical protein [Nostoc sp. UHCC 0252]|uniref:hypothetical protein n=1 Tax=Nostoc sp. UHCC 0252 TaxID=3110241 RepID=UPI002B1EE73C|nr:hypothetical protein [Nostoc sp. UHCC 0252]MEA5604739.1 hypothetical protein [Nostoc sp. UHCC 0252]